MNKKTSQYLTQFVKFLYTDLMMDTNIVPWNPIQESDQTMTISDNKILTTQRIYRTTDSKIMIKTITEVSTEQLKSISLTVCSNTVPLYSESDKLTVSVLKLIGMLDLKKEQVNLARDTQAYIDALIGNHNTYHYQSDQNTTSNSTATNFVTLNKSEVFNNED